MGDGFQYLDIVVFALIAGFLVMRLRSVLGRRTGNERRRDPFVPPRTGPAPPQEVPQEVLPPPRRGTVAAAAPAALAASIARIKSADPKFDEAAFLKGARAAFEIVINAFAKGDVATLKTLLSEAVYASFAEAIRARAAQHETLETTLLTIKPVQLVEAELEDDTVLVTVRFVSDQTNITRAADGSIVEGNPEEVVEKTDLWTFSRSVRSRDPNWVLVATTSA